MPDLPDTAGSLRARLRLVAVLVLGLLTAYWAATALYLLFLPIGASGATAAVVIGAWYLINAGFYALSTWGVAKRRRGVQLIAVAVAVFNIVFGIYASMTPIAWALLAANLVNLGLLTYTLPRKAAPAAS